MLFVVLGPHALDRLDDTKISMTKAERRLLANVLTYLPTIVVLRGWADRVLWIRRQRMKWGRASRTCPFDIIVYFGFVLRK